MSILDLPPEVLLDIFAHAVPPSPSRNQEDYLERTRTLLSFAVVHRQWTPLAQDSLLSEVWIGDTKYREGAIERKGRQLVQARVHGTKYLTIEGDIEALLRVTGVERWQNLVYLKNRPEYHVADSTRFDTFDRFLNLETLNLCYSNFSFEKSDFYLPFPKLQRLILFLQPILQGDPGIIQAQLCPAQMPNLTHLALDSPAYFRSDPAQLFELILPHITTLALSGPSTGYSNTALFRLIGRCSKLKHLSLAIKSNDLESLLFTDAAGMELESLHIASYAVGNSTTLLARLIALGKGEPKTIKIKRVVFYRLPPFEDFDGN